jgi:hypothetical protein
MKAGISIMSKNKTNQVNHSKGQLHCKQLNIPFDQNVTKVSSSGMCTKVVKIDTLVNQRKFDLINQIIFNTKSF